MRAGDAPPRARPEEGGGGYAGEVAALRAELQALRGGELAALRQEVDALRGGVRGAPAAAPLWRRESDGADVWYKSSAGDTAWELPPGAALAPPAGALAPAAPGVAPLPPPAVTWVREDDGAGDSWFRSSAGDTAWELPAGAVLAVAGAAAAPRGAGHRRRRRSGRVGGGAAGEGRVWRQASEDGDVWWVSSDGDIAWELPPGAVVEGSPATH
jgi:hypothetical protein